MRTELLSANVQIDQLCLCAGKEKMSNTDVPTPMEVETETVKITVLDG